MPHQEIREVEAKTVKNESIVTLYDGARDRLAFAAVFKPGDVYLNIRAGRHQSTPEAHT